MTAPTPGTTAWYKAMTQSIEAASLETHIEFTKYATSIRRHPAYLLAYELLLTAKMIKISLNSHKL